MIRGAGNHWEAYLRWNAALAEVVYGADAAGLPAYLDLEEDVLRRAAEHAGEQGGDREDLIRVVQSTLSDASSSHGVFTDHLTLLTRWHTSSGEPPPVIALLGVLCLAAEDMRGGDGFAPNNYYDRLMPLLGLVGEDSKKRVTSAYRQCSHQLWGCLNNWLEDLQGERARRPLTPSRTSISGRPCRRLCCGTPIARNSGIVHRLAAAAIATAVV